MHLHHTCKVENGRLLNLSNLDLEINISNPNHGCIDETLSFVCVCYQPQYVYLLPSENKVVVCVYNNIILLIFPNHCTSYRAHLGYINEPLNFVCVCYQP